MAVLTFTARLAHEFAIDIGNGFADGFAVRHLWFTYIGLHIELTLHAVDDDFQVQLAHTSDDGLTRFFIGTHAERRIFCSQTRQSQAHFLLVGFRFRFNSLGDYWLRENHFFQHDGCRRIAQGLARSHIFQADASGDVTSAALFDFFAFVGAHLYDTTDAFFFALGGVQYGVALVQNARVHAHESQLTNEGVGHQFECQAREFLCVIGLTRQHFLFVVRVSTSHIRDVGRCRQQV